MDPQHEAQDHSSPPGPKTVYVDWADLEAKLAARSTRIIASSSDSPPKRARMITTVDSEVDKLRANVKDSAKAVLTWVSALANHETRLDLDLTLNRFLRPGPDLRKLNYAALAEEIRDTTHIDLSAKRVKTAIDHLRRSHERKAKNMQVQTVKQRLDGLRLCLEANFAALTDTEPTERRSLRQSMASDVLATVRCAAGRLIENDFGEGIPQSVDLDELQDRFLDFVRDVMRSDTPATVQTLAEDLHRLLVTLCDYDRSAECDMQVVVDGSRVVADLMGPDSLFGALAQLNVLVAGRSLLGTDTYCAEMIRLARTTLSLHDDPATKTLMNWVRRQAEEQRVPSPIRVSSYCLNNAATHIFVRLFTGELTDTDTWLESAKSYLDQIRQRDSGFLLIKTTEVIHLTVMAELSGNDLEVTTFFAKLGPNDSLRRLEQLAKYESYDVVVQAAQNHAIRAIPQLKHQLIRVG